MREAYWRLLLWTSRYVARLRTRESIRRQRRNWNKRSTFVREWNSKHAPDWRPPDE